MSIRKTAESICWLVYAEHIGVPGVMSLTQFIDRLAAIDILPENVLQALRTIESHKKVPDEVHACLVSLARLTGWYFDDYLKITPLVRLQSGGDTAKQQQAIPSAIPLKNMTQSTKASLSGFEDLADECIADPHLLASKAEKYRCQNRFAEAVRYASISLELEPDYAFALQIRADAYRCQHRFVEAVRDASRSLELEPDNAFALRTRADAYRFQKKYPEAIQDASRSLELEPNNAFALRTRAEAFRRQSLFAEAARDATRALELEPNSAMALLTRAESYRWQKRFADALRDATHALAIDPDNALAKWTIDVCRNKV
jgi:tetratricopeptide (TPR) repeat protein